MGLLHLHRSVPSGSGNPVFKRNARCPRFCAASGTELYFEAGADFTLVRKDPVLPGLPVIPEWDRDYLERQEHAPGFKACRSCGHTVEANAATDCTVCRGDDWTIAVT